MNYTMISFFRFFSVAFIAMGIWCIYLGISDHGMTDPEIAAFGAAFACFVGAFMLHENAFPKVAWKFMSPTRRMDFLAYGHAWNALENRVIHFTPRRRGTILESSDARSILADWREKECIEGWNKDDYAYFTAVMGDFFGLTTPVKEVEIFA